MKKWEYNVYQVTNALISTAMDTLDSVGKKGWELVAVTALPSGVTQYTFKREIQK